MQLLDEPDLLAKVQSLEPAALRRIVDDIGLDDVGEIVALATTEQLLHVFDEDLWSSSSPGTDEAFDRRRFVRWLEVLLEGGAAAAARRVSELPEELIRLAFVELLFVVDFERLAYEMETTGQGGELAQIEKVLDATSYLELGEHVIVWRAGPGWDAMVTLLMELDRDHHPLLQRLIALASHASSERAVEHGGLYRLLTQEEMVASDAAADRADRRAGQGYIAASDATSFLRLARRTPKSRIIGATKRDPVTRAYFRELASPALEAESQTMTSESDGAPLPMLAVGDAQGSPTSYGFRAAMVTLRSGSPRVFATRMEELAFVVNVLMAGCQIESRALRPFEAADAAYALCELGYSELRAALPEATLEDHGVDLLCRLGWHVLPSIQPEGETILSALQSA